MDEDLFVINQPLTKRAIDQAQAARARIRDLEREIAAHPGTLWALQERIVQLEGLLRLATTTEPGGPA